MINGKERMDESILVCVYYGPNGERLIQRGCKLANMLDCPLYILTVDSKPFDELDAEKSNYISRWKELAERHSADAFIIKDKESRPISKVIAEVAREKTSPKLFSVKQRKVVGSRLQKVRLLIRYYVKSHSLIFISFRSLVF